MIFEVVSSFDAKALAKIEETECTDPEQNRSAPEIRNSRSGNSRGVDIQNRLADQAKAGRSAAGEIDCVKTGDITKRRLHPSCRKYQTLEDR